MAEGASVARSGRIVGPKGRKLQWTRECGPGWYRPGQTIAVGVKNLSTWALELSHAADDRFGELHRSNRPDREIVAELAGATLLECLWHKAEADRGGAWEYIQSWARSRKIQPLTACNRLLERTCKVVELILTEAAALELVAA